LPFDSDGERRRGRISRSCGNREALPLDRLWKAEQIGGGKEISQHLWLFIGAGKQFLRGVELSPKFPLQEVSVTSGPWP